MLERGPRGNVGNEGLTSVRRGGETAAGLPDDTSQDGSIRFKGRR